MRSERIGAVEFPTLGHLIDAWIEQHCRIADGWKRRQPFVEYDVQFMADPLEDLNDLFFARTTGGTVP